MIRPVEYAPAGTRWPWLPLFTFDVDMGDLRPVRTDEGMTSECTLTVVGEVQRGRVGMRRWAKSRWALLRRTIRRDVASW